MATLLNTILTTDAAGNATWTFPITAIGHLEKICIDYTGLAAGTDVTVQDNESGHVYLQLLNNNVDGCWHPRADACDNVGANRLYVALGTIVGTYDYCEDNLTINVAQGGAGGTAEVWIWLRH